MRKSGHVLGLYVDTSNNVEPCHLEPTRDAATTTKEVYRERLLFRIHVTHSIQTF